MPTDMRASLAYYNQRHKGNVYANTEITYDPVKTILLHPPLPSGLHAAQSKSLRYPETKKKDDKKDRI